VSEHERAKARGRERKRERGQGVERKRECARARCMCVCVCVCERERAHTCRLRATSLLIKRHKYLKSNIIAQRAAEVPQSPSSYSDANTFASFSAPEWEFVSSGECIVCVYRAHLQIRKFTAHLQKYRAHLQKWRSYLRKWKTARWHFKLRIQGSFAETTGSFARIP